MLQKPSPDGSFQGLGLAPALLTRLDQLGFKEPTPIQQKALPVALVGEDLIGIAQTGSGKTLAFALPMLQRIAATKTIGLVLLPTRELAVQVEETFVLAGKGTGLRTALLIGGVKPFTQLRQLKNNPHVIIATPGRLIDHLDQKKVTLSRVGSLVLDEADRMLDMGFAPQLKQILTHVPTERQTMLFSATMPDEIAAMARTYMKKPLRIEVAQPGTTADKIDQEVFIVPRADKPGLLKRLLNEYSGSVLIFSRTKHGAKKIARLVRDFGHTADEIHSNRTQVQRQKALKGFSMGRYRILVATDIASRGIDVKNIELVLNYDLPDQIEDYVHRIGRTGRAGKSGKAITFVAPEQKRDLAQIERLIKIQLPVKSTSGEVIEKISDSGRQRGRSKPRRSRGPRSNTHSRRRSPSRSRGPRNRSGNKNRRRR